MKKFKFRLDGVLDYREQVEKERQVALTKVHRLVAEHEQKLIEAYAVLDSAREDLRAQERGGEIDVAQARQHRLHIGALRKQVSEVLKRLRKLEVELASRREEAVQARKERKVLEMLKAKRRAEYVKEADRFEQAELDDIAQKQEVLKRTGT